MGTSRLALLTLLTKGRNLDTVCLHYELVGTSRKNDQRKSGQDHIQMEPYARPKGRPRVRWEDDVRNDLRKMGVTSWKQRMQERKQWKEIIEQAKTHKEF